MEISSDIRARIIAAAEKLFDEAGREKFPAVDQVRRLARADMNTTSAVMKDWRRQQTTASGPVAIEVPARIREVFQNALAEAWQEAQDMANETLQAAQLAWESERRDAESLRGEIADSYEVQAKELDEARQQLAVALERAETAEQLRKDREQEYAALEASRAHYEKQVGLLAEELEEVKKKLDVARSELAMVQAKAELKVSKAVDRHKEVAMRLDEVLVELDGLKRESAEAVRKAERTAGEARERAAGLTGQLEALATHNRELMVALKGGTAGKEGG